MRLMLFLWLSFSLGSLAQPVNPTAGLLRPVDDSLFRSCPDLQRRALELAGRISDRVFFMELYPRSAKPLFRAFLADGGMQQKFYWLTKFDVHSPPYALLYYINGAYALRCRDDQGRAFETAGPKGQGPSASTSNPLVLGALRGTTTIWHFSITPTDVARVFVITSSPLRSVNGERLLAEVKERLDGRYVFLYVRNDPWFFGNASDSVPFIFADPSTHPTEEQYKASETMICITDNGPCTVHSIP
jgi:hypothetical protein